MEDYLMLGIYIDYARDNYHLLFYSFMLKLTVHYSFQIVYYSLQSTCRRTSK